jgi:hypothetical protein
MSEIRLYKGKRPVAVTMEILFKTVKSVLATGNEEAFLAQCRENGLTIAAGADVVNAVKTHLFEHKAQLTDAHAAAVAGSPPGDPNCFPKTRLAADIVAAARALTAEAPSAKLARPKSARPKSAPDKKTGTKKARTKAAAKKAASPRKKTRK